MSGNSWARPILRAMLLAVAVAALPAAALAQTGRITGTVTSQEGAPVQGAQVSVTGTRWGTLSDAAGRFVVTGVPAGRHELSVRYTGYTTANLSVEVRDGEASNVQVVLEGQPIEIGGVVVSASRRAERITDAPATISLVDAATIDMAVGNSWGTLLKDVKGLDYIQTGMTTAAVNARGFNSSFNNRMLMMEDGRIAVLPENGLPVGQFTATPKVDLAGVEVLIGPGAALYGADASSGVVTLMTRDPRMYPGTTVEVTGGSRAYRDIQARHAGVVGDWGFKVSGEWQEAEEWSRSQSYTITGVPGRGTVVVPDTALGPNSIDWNAGVIRGSGAVVRYFEDARLEVSAGASRTDGVGQTNVGHNQLRDWGYNFAQARFSNPNWYLNAYRTQSTSGESFALNRYADAMARNPSLSPDSLRMLSDWPSDGQLYAAEVQNNFRLPALLNTHFVWGAQYRQDIVSSERQWLTDRLTGEDIKISQYGVYGQADAPITSWLNAVMAVRYDDHENYDAQFSPKAALVFKPAPDQALRVSYNRAFKSPTTLQTNFHIPDWTAVVSIFGNTRGFTVQGGPNGTVSYAPLKPEENVTWEAGYKGIFGERLYVDVAGYYSEYKDFLSPLAIISDPFGIGLAGHPQGVQTFAFDADGNRILNEAGIPPVMLTYYNLGEATIYGTDAGVNYYLTPRVKLRGTASWLKVEEMEVPAGREEATSLNAPSTKWTAGADFTQIGHFLDGQGNFFGGFTVRHVGSYYFRSGINMGVIPTFTSLDLNAGYQIPRIHSTLNVGISNLFTCSQRDDQPFEYAASDPFRTSPTNKERECGVGVKHQEMINMPQIGTMLFVGLRYHLQ